MQFIQLKKQNRLLLAAVTHSVTHVSYVAPVWISTSAVHALPLTFEPRLARLRSQSGNRREATHAVGALHVDLTAQKTFTNILSRVDPK